MRNPSSILARTRLTVLGLVIASCSSNTASIEQSWRAPEARRGELRNVVTVFVSRDGALRRNAEDKLAQRLARSGVRAAPAYRVLTTEELQDRPRAIARLRAANVDGVVVMRVVGKEQPTGSLDVYSDLAWTAAYELIPETIVRIETNAYSLANNKLIWSAMSKSIEPANVDELIDDVTQVVTRELGRQGLLALAANGSPR